MYPDVFSLKVTGATNVEAVSLMFPLAALIQCNAGLAISEVEASRSAVYSYEPARSWTGQQHEKSGSGLDYGKLWKRKTLRRAASTPVWLWLNALVPRQKARNPNRR